MCNTGSHQSPIDLEHTEVKEDMNVKIYYTAIKVPKAPVEGEKPKKLPKIYTHFHRNQQ